MCGIFAYLGQTSLPISQVPRLLRILESDQEPNEKTPVGGHGAGIAYLNEKGRLTLEKVAKTKGSPSSDLLSKLGNNVGNSHLILGHVRRASPEFKDTTQYREFAQPYQPNCKHNQSLSVVSAHNGFLQNYQKLSQNLTSQHTFESQGKIRLNDSEVIAHMYEELLTQTGDSAKAAHLLYEQIEGNNTAVVLTVKKNEAHLYAIHKGKTRGFVVWTDPKGEVIICSREKPVQIILGRFLKENNHQEIIHITRNDSISIQTHWVNTHLESTTSEHRNATIL